MFNEIKVINSNQYHAVKRCESDCNIKISIFFSFIFFEFNFNKYCLYFLYVLNLL
jgi:hypothetical protein